MNNFTVVCRLGNYVLFMLIYLPQIAGSFLLHIASTHHDLIFPFNLTLNATHEKTAGVIPHRFLL